MAAMFFRNLQFTGPNAYYPAAGYVPPSAGSGISVLNSWDNTFENCSAFGFNNGVYLDQGYNNKFSGSCEFQFNEHGVYIVSTGTNGTNINIFDGTKIRENRSKGVVIDGTPNSKGAYPTGNRFINCYVESNTPWQGGYASGGPGDGSKSVGFWLRQAYSTVVDNTYSENHEFSIWIDNQSSRNIFKSVRHDFGGGRTRLEKIRIKGSYCLNNKFIDIEQSSNESDTHASVSVLNSTSTGTEIVRPVGLRIDPSVLAAHVTIVSAKLFALDGGTRIGRIEMPPTGYVSNPSAGTGNGQIEGIGTLNATLHCYGLGEISLQSNVNANTTITTFKGLAKGQIFVLWNYDNTRSVTIKSTDRVGPLYLRDGLDVVLSNYADHLVFYVNGLGRVVEIGRNVLGSN